MKSKKAMELSVNFIVTFILAVVLFGMGIIFARSIMSGGTELSEQTYERFDNQIGDLVCSRGESVCVSVNNKEIERNDVAAFPITIKNELPSQQEFQITVAEGTATAKDNTVITSPDKEKVGFMPNEQTFFLNPGESETIPILVLAAKDSFPGRYSFRVFVKSRNSGSSDPFQFYPDDKPKVFIANVK